MRGRIADFIGRVWNFFKLTRAPFLLGGFLLYALGAAAAARRGIAIQWPAYWLGQALVTSIQLMAHYANEYFDQEVDRVSGETRTWFSGGSGILPQGGVSPAAVLTASRICAAAALLTGILACILSPWMIPIVLFSFLASWFYSAPPIALMSSGWGELTTSIIVALLLPLAGYAMQAGFPPGEIWLVSVPLILVHAAMIISFEFPDLAADRSVGKHTLTVRLGDRRAAWLVSALIAGAFLIIAALALFSKYPGRWMVWALPLGLWQMAAVQWVIHAPARARYHILTTGGAGLFVLLALLALAGFVLPI
jgi:1,4-dihydroxy-2-naphthoate octaprenyltransferase